MRYAQPAALAVAAISMAVSQAPAQEALGEEGFGFFYDSLAPYGDWLEIAGHGPCWRPEVEEGWSPYTDGYWAYTDVGWTWVSHEPFGSIVYHYGRWLLSNRGWCWVPGADWSPAWVSWRTGGDYIGWAPLPPEVPWYPQRGISTWVDVHTEIGPAYYRFCSVRDFSSPSLTGVLLRPSRNAVIMVRTENVTQITVRNSSVFCGGPRYDWVAARTSGGVPLLRVAREENVRHYRSLQGSGGGVQNFVYNNILVLPAPRRVDCSSDVRNFKAPPASVSVSKGWYSDASGNERLRSHISSEWEQRRTSQQAPGGAKESGAPPVRLSAPTIEEKRAVLNEIASAPPPAPRSGTGRSESDLRGAGSAGGERPGSVTKALPARSSQAPLIAPGSQKPGNGDASPVLGTGSDRGMLTQPGQGGTPSGINVTGGRVGGPQSLPAEPNDRAFPRSTVGGISERTSGQGGQVAQPFNTNQTGRNVPMPQDPGANIRTQTKAGVSAGIGGGAVPGSLVAPVRPSGETSAVGTQPQGARTGQNFPQQGGTGVSGVPPRGGVQGVPFGGSVRGGGGTTPVQAAPIPRTAQPTTMADQSFRAQSPGTGQTSRPGQPSSVASGPSVSGVPGTGRPQTAPPVNSVAPPSAPAAPAGAAQKKKPGDPGYVPGTP